MNTSSNLKQPKLLTTVTYQGLHSAFNKLIDKDISDNDIEEDEVEIDYSNFDLIKNLLQANIKTICLDEAHHLRNEWYKSLSKVIETLGEDIIIIALTATPPYDSTPQEWDRYTNLCGEIDEEIFVPELIKKNNLCPHQDFIYFNYPTKQEQASLIQYQRTVEDTLYEIFKSKEFDNIITDFLITYKGEVYPIFEETQVFITLIQIAKRLGYKIPAKLKRLLRERSYFDKYKIKYTEEIPEYIIKNPDMFGEINSKYLKDTLYKNGLIERRKVYLNKSSKLKKKIISSIGKLESIADIAKFESNQLGQDLKMLILTDYIKKDQIELIGSNEPITSMGAVPIFEKVRQSVNQDIRLVLLSGSLVIYPENELDILKEVSDKRGLTFSKKKLPDSPHYILNFKSNNKNIVDTITEIFELGYIDIIIGTKSLLGEGWHLATVENTSITSDLKEKLDIVGYIVKDKSIQSADYDMLQRRFDAFLGPAYLESYVSSGIDRIDYIKPPFTKQRFNTFNEVALNHAKDRNNIKEKWDTVLDNNYTSEIIEQSEVKDEAMPFGIILMDLSILSVFSLALTQLLYRLAPHILTNTFAFIVFAIIIVLYTRFIYNVLPRIILNISPKNRMFSMAKVLLETLKDIGEIESKNCQAVIKKNKGAVYSYISLVSATRHEKAVFTKSLQELFSAIDNPRYVIIKSRDLLGVDILTYKESYSVPKVIATNKQNVETFIHNLKRTKGRFVGIYTRTFDGRKKLLKCKRRSHVSSIDSHVLSRRVVKKQF